jgi:hypothetical protein
MNEYWVEARRGKRRELIAFGVWHDTTTACECVKEFKIGNDPWATALQLANRMRDKLNDGEQT